MFSKIIIYIISNNDERVKLILAIENNSYTGYHHVWEAYNLT